jgi:hypothetical protein
MVAAVPAQTSKLRPRPPATACRRYNDYLLPTAHYPLSFCHPFVFLVLQIPSPACPTTLSFVFMYLQIPCPATPLFSHPYKTPGCHPSPRPLCSDLSALCVAVFPAARHFPFAFISLPPLCLSFPSFAGTLPLFSTVYSLFSQNTGGGVPQSCSPLVTRHFTQQPAWWKRVQVCQSE